MTERVLNGALFCYVEEFQKKGVHNITIYGKIRLDNL